MLQATKLSILRNATWTLSNLFRGKPPPSFELVAPALPILSRLVFSDDEEVLTDACWSLSYLTTADGKNDKIQAVIESGVCKRIALLLRHPSYSVQIPALRVIGNIVTGDDLQTQSVINLGALPSLNLLLGSPKKNIRKEACWTISNITAGSRAQIQAVIDAKIVPPLIHLLANDEFDVRKEAAWAVSNITSGGSSEQVKLLIAHNCIKPLCELLVLPDSRIILVALEGIENVLTLGLKEAGPDGENPYVRLVEEAEGVEKIDALQSHPNPEIYHKAMEILEMYFGGEEDDRAVLPQQAPGLQQYSFTANAQMPQSGFNFYR
jgi:hypothetical protein